MRRRIIILMVVVLAAVSTPLSVSASTYKPYSMYLSVTNKVVDIKGKATIKVKSVKPSKASRSVTYKSSNRRIATVSSNGVVTGKRSGKVRITVTSRANKKLKKVISITVKNLRASKVTVSCPRSDLYVGEKAKATVKITAWKGYYNPGVYWKSSNRSVAAVSTGGTITAVAPGTATITATSKDGSGKYGKITI